MHKLFHAISSARQRELSAVGEEVRQNSDEGKCLMGWGQCPGVRLVKQGGPHLKGQEVRLHTVPSILLQLLH